ncbi:MAG TPA: tetratricopeptide repeat protein [Ignavibacteriaceae bacterium]
MTKKEFHILLTNYTALTPWEALEILNLEKEFPYSQVIHGLAARATQDNQLPEQEEQLHLGAIYTTDRAVFKSIMTASAQKRIEVFEEQPQEELSKYSSGAKLEITTENEPPISLASDQRKIHAKAAEVNDSFYDEILHDLERLKQSKLEFEETMRLYENGALPLTSGNDTPQKKKKQADSINDLITEIKSSKKKIDPEGPKQKEQIEIIDQFIKTQPTIKGKVAGEEKSAPKDDLTENSLMYNENIISETLAEILIKQGKKDKAIDVLKKLIWKFPQKKAYFAAQIEELKK